MEKENKFNMSPQELTALASSLAINLSREFNCRDLNTLRNFFNALSANLSLLENQILKNEKQDK